VFLAGELEILLLGFKSRVKVTFQLFEAGDGGASQEGQLEDVYLLQVNWGASHVKKLGLLEDPTVDVVGGWEEDLEAKAANDLELLLLLVL
jgi:hypothetical protein